MLAEAINVLEECLAAQRVFLSPDHQHIGITLWHLGELYKARDDLEKATEMWRDCLSVFEKCLPSAHPHLFRVLRALAHIKFGQRQYEESLQMYGRLRDILVKVSPVSRETAIVCHNMGVFYMELSHFGAAEGALSHAGRIKSAIFPHGHESISKTEQELHRVWQLKFGQ